LADIGLFQHNRRNPVIAERSDEGRLIEPKPPFAVVDADYASGAAPVINGRSTLTARTALPAPS
jgi:hypothetical protein